MLANVQHSSSKIELVQQLSNEDVDFEDSLGIFLFQISDDVNEPFKSSLTSAHPEEVDLLDGECVVVLDLEDDILKNRGERGNSDTSSDKNGSLIF